MSEEIEIAKAIVDDWNLGESCNIDWEVCESCQ